MMQKQGGLKALYMFRTKSGLATKLCKQLCIGATPTSEVSNVDMVCSHLDRSVAYDPKIWS